MPVRALAAAPSVLEWSPHGFSPCPGECNVDSTAFDVKEIPEAQA
jgi:hypothetical protein